MEIPNRYNSIIEDLVTRSNSYGRKNRVPPPTIIKGGMYSGANLLLHEVFRRMEVLQDSAFALDFLTFRLSDDHVSSELVRALSLRNKVHKKSIFFLDGIDRLLNLSVKSLKKNPKTGRAFKAKSVVEEAHNLRKVLLEASNEITLFSSSSMNTEFMEDPDLPFYKFFNEITVTPLTPEETVKYLFSNFRKANFQEFKTDIINELGEISIEWAFRLTGGNWLLIQKFYQVISQFQKLTRTNSKATPCVQLIDEYLLQLQPIFLAEIANFSREERRFVENAALLGSKFGLKDLNFVDGNASLVAIQLVEKGILVKADKMQGGYIFAHVALRTFLRHFSKYDAIDVFSDTQILRRLL